MSKHSVHSAADSIVSHNIAGDEVSDHDLILKLQDIDKRASQRDKSEAYEQLLERHYKRFYYLAFRLLQDTQDAEDCVQECFLKLWHKPHIWNAERGASFQTFFTHIVVNHARDMHRKGKFLKLFKGQSEQGEERDDSDPMMQASASLTMASPRQPQDDFDAKQRAVRLKKAMEALPHRQREAVTLCFYEEFSNAEASKIMGVGIKALESLLMRAKKNLRHIIEDKEGER